MSKHLKKKNPPAPSSDEEDDPLSQELADPVAVTVAGSTKGPCKDVDVEPSSSLATEDGWKRLVEQIDSLQAVLLNLVTLVASSMVSGPVREIPPVEERAAIAPASGATWRETAIVGGLPSCGVGVLQVRLDGPLRTRLPESSPSSLVARASTFGVVYRVGPHTGPGKSTLNAPDAADDPAPAGSFRQVGRSTPHSPVFCDIGTGGASLCGGG
ncbi:unnamed protein product [Lampetra fluviatilis]